MEAPADLYQMTEDPAKAPDSPEKLVIEFKNGEDLTSFIIPSETSARKYSPGDSNGSRIFFPGCTNYRSTPLNTAQHLKFGLNRF